MGETGLEVRCKKKANSQLAHNEFFLRKLHLQNGILATI